MKNKDVLKAPKVNYFPNSTWFETQKGDAVLRIDAVDLNKLKDLHNNKEVAEHVLYTSLHALIFSPLITPKQLSCSVVFYMVVEATCILISKFPLRNSKKITATSAVYEVQDAVVRTYDIVKLHSIDKASELVRIYATRFSKVGAKTLEGCIVHPSILEANTMNLVLGSLLGMETDVTTVWLAKLSSDAVFISEGALSKACAPFSVARLLTQGVPTDLSRIEI